MAREQGEEMSVMAADPGVAVQARRGHFLGADQWRHRRRLVEKGEDVGRGIQGQHLFKYFLAAAHAVEPIVDDRNFFSHRCELYTAKGG